MTVFRGSTFNGDAEFDGTEFNGITQFSHFSVYDSGPAKITIFNSKAIFSHSAFKGTIDFSGAEFNGDANFVNSVFDSSKENVIRFSFSQFHKNAYFDDSMFNGRSEFNWCQFSGDASFENTKFNGVLYLTRTRYDKFYIYWRDITNLSYDDATYLSLVNNFKKLGYFDDANNCYYDYMDLKRDRAPNFSKSIEYFLLDSICGYGVRWTYTIRSALYTWIFFALVYYFSGGRLSKGSLMFSAVALFLE